MAEADKKILQTCLSVRTKIQKGLNLVKALLNENSSKLTVSICCFLAKRVLNLTRENSNNLKKVNTDKENLIKSAEIKRLTTILLNEKSKI